MESKIGKFIGRLSRGEKAKNPKPKKDGPDFGRRDFLKNAGLLGAAAVLGVPTRALAEVQNPNESKTKTENVEQKEAYEKLKKVIDEIRLKNIEKEKTDGPKESWTTAELENYRNLIKNEYEIQLTSHFQNTGEHMFEQFWLGSPLEWAYAILAVSDNHGLIYKFLHQKNLYKDRTQKIDRESLWKHHFSARAEDFLPTSDEIGDGEIDPRLNATDVFHLYTGNEAKNVAEENLIKNPGWSAPEKIKIFKEILDNVAIRQKIVEHKLDISSAYSLIKAVVSYQERNPQTLLGIEEIAEKLLQERNIFYKKEIIGPTTDEFIYFNFTDPKWPEHFDERKLREIAIACGINEEKIHGTNSGGDGLKKGERPHENYLTDVSQSQGNTTIYLNTHGSKDGIEIDNGLLDIYFTIDALFLRLEKTKDPKELGKITLIIDTCYSYDMAENFIDRLKSVYSQKSFHDEKNPFQTTADVMGVPFSEISLPKIITSTQRGSLGFAGRFSMVNVIHDHVVALSKEGCLNGESLIELIHPHTYPVNDMTVFNGQKGDAIEIAANLSTPQSQSSLQSA